MIKTSLEVEADIYRLIKDSELGRAIKGNVYRRGYRPADSKKEDIIVHFLSGTPSQFQRGVVIVNAYVPDVTLGNGQRISDTARLTELAQLIRPTLHANTSEYDIVEDEMATVEQLGDMAQSVLTIRLRFMWVAR